MTALKSSFGIYDIFDVWEDTRVVYQSPQVSSVKEAQYILIGEDHFSDLGLVDQAAIINQLVVEGSVLVLEGVAALTEVSLERRKKLLKTREISEEAQNVLSVTGWDYFNYVENPDHKVFICKYEESGESSIFVDSESIFPLGERVQLLRDVASTKGFVPEDLQLLSKKIMEKAAKQYSDEIADTFPLRTRAMVHTLKSLEIERLAGKIPGKIFLIAGALHLEQNASSDKRFSLESLYDCLKDLPSVILAPKFS